MAVSPTERQRGNRNSISDKNASQERLFIRTDRSSAFKLLSRAQTDVFYLPGSFYGWTISVAAPSCSLTRGENQRYYSHPWPLNQDPPTEELHVGEKRENRCCLAADFRPASKLAFARWVMTPCGPMGTINNSPWGRLRCRLHASDHYKSTSQLHRPDVNGQTQTQKCSRLQVISVTCYATLPHRIERKLDLTLLRYLIPVIESWSPLRALICLALIQCLWNRSEERGPWVCRISGLVQLRRRKRNM